MKRDQALQLFSEAVEHAFPMRWVMEDVENQEDFAVVAPWCNGFEYKIQVFNIFLQEQFPFLHAVQPVQELMPEMVGSLCSFIFHDPDETRWKYPEFFKPRPKEPRPQHVFDVYLDPKDSEA